MTVDTLGVYWSARPETARECASRLRKCLEELAQQFPALADWYLKGSSPNENQVSVARFSDEDLLSLVEGGANRKDIGGQPVPHLGFGVGLWNGRRERAAAGMSIRCGQFSQNKMLVNSMVMDLPNDLETAALDSDEALQRLLLLQVKAWEAEWGAVYSTRSAVFEDRTSPGPFLDRMLWLRSGENSSIVAGDVVAQSVAGGTIYSRNL